MRRVTSLLMMATFLFAGNAFGQQTDYTFTLERTDDTNAPFAGLHEGVRTVAGPFDLDNDGQKEVLVSDYTGGGRVHVIETTGPNTWELVYSTPWLDDSPAGNLANNRAMAGGDLDGDGFGEIVFFSGCKSQSISVGQYCGDVHPFDNPDYPAGLYVFEFTGVDDDYGSQPATIYEIDGVDRFQMEQMTIADIDNDGDAELFFW